MLFGSSRYIVLPTKQGTIKGENMVFDIESIEL
jgi:hypothetical protein